MGKRGERKRKPSAEIPTEVSRSASGKIVRQNRRVMKAAAGYDKPGNPGYTGGYASSGRPGKPPRSGKQPSGLRIKDSLNKMMNLTLWEVEKTLADEAAPISERLAADRILIALKTGGHRGDRAFDQIADRTEGKPHQSHDVRAITISNPEAVLQDIYDSLGVTPEGDVIEEPLLAAPAQRADVEGSAEALDG